MNVLLINKYPSLEGGADREMLNLAYLLKQSGHKVVIFAANINSKLDPNFEYKLFNVLDVKNKNKLSIFQQFKVFINIIYNFNVKKTLINLLKEFKPDVAHLHNIHFEVSVSVIDVLKNANIPTIMHLHDARLFCPNGFLFTKGRYCNKCFYHKYYNCFLNKCVKNSYSGSFAVMASFYYSYITKVFYKVDRFIIPTEVVKNFAINSGIKKEKIKIIDYPAPINTWVPNYEYEDYFVFYGQHLVSKGLIELINAMKLVPKDIKLLVVGKGTITEKAKILAKDYDNIVFKGFVPDDELKIILSKALFVVLPSIGFENSNCIIREANSLGKAVLGSKIGGIPELIINEKTGLLFTSNNINELSQKITYLFNNKEETINMGKNAREFVEKNNKADDYLQKIIQTYNEVLFKEK